MSTIVPMPEHDVDYDDAITDGTRRGIVALPISTRLSCLAFITCCQPARVCLANS